VTTQYWRLQRRIPQGQWYVCCRNRTTRRWKGIASGWSPTSRGTLQRQPGAACVARKESTLRGAEGTSQDFSQGSQPKIIRAKLPVKPSLDPETTHLNTYPSNHRLVKTSWQRQKFRMRTQAV